MYIIDRRLNPKGKNIGNRQRFIRRARAEISKVVELFGQQLFQIVPGGTVHNRL